MVVGVLCDILFVVGFFYLVFVLEGKIFELS